MANSASQLKCERTARRPFSPSLRASSGSRDSFSIAAAAAGGSSGSTRIPQSASPTIFSQSGKFEQTTGRPQAMYSNILVEYEST